MESRTARVHLASLSAASAQAAPRVSRSFKGGSVRRAALIALLALAASSCSIDIGIDISLQQDGSGSLAVDIDVDDEFIDLYRLTGREFEDLIATRGPSLGLPFTVTPGTVTRYTASTNVVSADTLAQILEGLAPGIGEVEIAAEEGTLQFDGRLNPLTGIADVAPYFVDESPLQFSDAVDVTVSLAMPGEIDSTTGSNSQSGPLTWTVPFSDSETRLFASSVLESPGRPIPWTLIAVAITLIFAVGFLISVKSSLAQNGEETAPMPLREPGGSIRPPEEQVRAPEATPPEEQPVAPPAEGG